MEVPREGRAPAPRSLLVAAAITYVLTALCILALDQPVARWLAGYEPLGVWDRILGWLEWLILLPVFSWTLAGLLALALIVTVAVPRLRGAAPALMLIIATHAISRYLTLQLKLGTDRLRPSEWLKQGGDSFGHVDGISFPSGHVAIFASLLIPLAVAVPRARPLLGIVAFVGLARIAVNAHFLSDVIGGLTVVCVVTYLASLVVRPVVPAARR